jgi:hypothetical protein
MVGVCRCTFRGGADREKGVEAADGGLIEVRKCEVT